MKRMWLSLLLSTLTACTVETIPYVHPIPENPGITIIQKHGKVSYKGGETGLTEVQRDQLMYMLKGQAIAEIRLQECFMNEDSLSYNSRVMVLKRYLLSRGYKNVLIIKPRAKIADECPCIYLEIAAVDFNHTECQQMPYFTPHADPFSCATNKNLYNMLSNPHDLNAHKEIGSYNGERLSRAIERYQNPAKEDLYGQ